MARDQAQEQVERLQGTLRDLQRHAQDRSSYDELQERFKEVSDQWFASHQSVFYFVHDALVNDSWKAWWRLDVPDHQLYCPPSGHHSCNGDHPEQQAFLNSLHVSQLCRV